MSRQIHSFFRRVLLAMFALGLYHLGGPAWAGAPRSLHFQHLGIEEGLPQESVITILQDRTGFMWLGTQAGLVRFDGYRHRVFRNDPNDASSLPDNFVQASYEDREGRLWFGTRGGAFLRGTVIGHGVVPVEACLRILKNAGYDGTVAIEFEGMEPCEEAVALSRENLAALMQL